VIAPENPAPLVVLKNPVMPVISSTAAFAVVVKVMVRFQRFCPSEK